MNEKKNQYALKIATAGSDTGDPELVQVLGGELSRKEIVAAILTSESFEKNYPKVVKRFLDYREERTYDRRSEALAILDDIDVKLKSATKELNDSLQNLPELLKILDRVSQVSEQLRDLRREQNKMREMLESDENAD